MSEQKKSRRSLVLQSTVAGGVATAVLLGGFGAFSLWNDSLEAGGHSITTGALELTGADNVVWKIIKTDGVLPANKTIDLADFKASPGDVLQYTADIGVRADASDMLAELTIDPATYRIENSLKQYVTVDLTDAAGDPIQQIELDGTHGTQSVPVKVTVAFSPKIEGKTGQDLGSAVNLSGLQFKLDQVAGS